METANQKSIIHLHTKKKKESKHNTKDSHQSERKRVKEEERNEKEL